jgi:AraC-like DNA-binding protein
MQEIDSFVERHLSDAGMSAAQVATACKISRRYLYRLLDARQTTFSEMLWAKRREQARRWLCAPQMRQCSIGEIAVRAGFRSLSHFSESFKRHYGSTPSAYRKATSDAAAIVEGAGA